MRTRAMATAVVVLAGALALAAGGCASLRGGFACATNGQCVRQGTAGTCEPNGYCSFPDGTCASGRRYGEWAGQELSGVCVDEEFHDGGPKDAQTDGQKDAAADAGDAATLDAPDGPTDAQEDGQQDAQQDGQKDAQQDAQHDTAVCDPPWWNASWTKRKQLTITNNASSMLPLNFQVGASLDVDLLIGGGTWDQIRVVRWTGAWTELTRVLDNSATECVWFRLVSTIDASATDASYWLYYGNAAAGAAPSDPAQVFDFYDNFSSAPDTRWLKNNTPTASGGELVLDYDDSIGTVQTWGPGYAVDVRLRINPVSQRFWLGWHVVAGGFPDVNPWFLWITRQDGSIWPEWTINGATPYPEGTHRSLDTSIRYYSVDRFSDRAVYRRENVVMDNLAFGSSFTTSLPVRITNETVSGTVYVDMARVRQTIYPLPTTSWGAEETCN